MKKESKQRKISKIAIFRTDRVGEVLLATPVIEALKRKFPWAKISFVTSSYARDIVSDRADLEEVIGFDTIGRKVLLWEALPLSFKLQRRRFNMAVILNPHKVLHLAVYLAGIPYRVGYDRKWGGLLNYKIKDTRDEGRMHEVEYNLQLLETVGIKEEAIPPFIPVLARNSYYVRGLLEQVGLSGKRKIAVVHPGSSNPAKRWPFENFHQLVKKLAACGKVDIIAVGDRKEKGLCEKVVSGLGDQALNLAGLFTLRKLTALFKAVDLLITNDNGPMHIAAAVGTKVIAIFGRNIPGVGPKRWGPYGKGHTVFHKDPGCSPCYDKDCPYDFKCLKSITADEVFQAALDSIGDVP